MPVSPYKNQDNWARVEVYTSAKDVNVHSVVAWSASQIEQHSRREETSSLLVAAKSGVDPRFFGGVAFDLLRHGLHLLALQLGRWRLLGAASVELTLGLLLLALSNLEFSLCLLLRLLFLSLCFLLLALPALLMLPRGISNLLFFSTAGALGGPSSFFFLNAALL